MILTTGTFLRGMIHIGETKIPAGRVGEAPALGLAATLKKLGFDLGRLKTGTPARLDGRTIDWAATQEQPGDDAARAVLVPDGGDHDAADQLLHHPDHGTRPTKSSGATFIARRCTPAQIEGRGPRYCPSIEDKVVRFADKDSHQIFLEPEGLDDRQGLSRTGFRPRCREDVQQALLATIPGLEKARDHPARLRHRI